jgi:hypothetical protein
VTKPITRDVPVPQRNHDLYRKRRRWKEFTSHVMSCWFLVMDLWIGLDYPGLLFFYCLPWSVLRDTVELRGRGLKASAIHHLCDTFLVYIQYHVSSLVALGVIGCRFGQDSLLAPFFALRVKCKNKIASNKPTACYFRAQKRPAS